MAIRRRNLVAVAVLAWAGHTYAMSGGKAAGSQIKGTVYIQVNGKTVLARFDDKQNKWVPDESSTKELVSEGGKFVEKKVEQVVPEPVRYAPVSPIVSSAIPAQNTEESDFVEERVVSEEIADRGLNNQPLVYEQSHEIEDDQRSTESFEDWDNNGQDTDSESSVYEQPYVPGQHQISGHQSGENVKTQVDGLFASAKRKRALSHDSASASPVRLDELHGDFTNLSTDSDDEEPASLPIKREIPVFESTETMTRDISEQLSQPQTTGTDEHENEANLGDHNTDSQKTALNADKSSNWFKVPVIAAAVSLVSYVIYKYVYQKPDSEESSEIVPASEL